MSLLLELETTNICYKVSICIILNSRNIKGRWLYITDLVFITDIFAKYK